jgi:hypothetical protein
VARAQLSEQVCFSHVLLECPKLRDLRIELRRNVGDALNSVSSLLGGSNEGERGKPDTVLEPRHGLPWPIAAPAVRLPLWRTTAKPL